MLLLIAFSGLVEFSVVKLSLIFILDLFLLKVLHDFQISDAFSTVPKGVGFNTKSRKPVSSF